jgi:hypothetical protein
MLLRIMRADFLHVRPALGIRSMSTRPWWHDVIYIYILYIYNTHGLLRYASMAHIYILKLGDGGGTTLPYTTQYNMILYNMI